MSEKILSIKDLGKVLGYNEEGVPVEFSWFWAESVAALVFVRHFG